MKNSLLIEPNEIAFVTTDKCTAACANCCFQCRPQNTNMLTYVEMKEYIDRALADFPNIMNVIFTGGECFLLGSDLDKIISYASARNLSVRVVTNGYWARSFKSTYLRLRQLKQLGLKEVNVSTGDEHQEWVKFDYVINVIVASLLLGLTIVVNVESSPDSMFKVENLTNDVRLKKYNTSSYKNFYVLKGEWMYFRKHQSEKGLQSCNLSQYTRCSSLFKDIIVFPTKKQYACCGLTNKYIPYMYLGDLACHSIKELYSLQFDDFMKIWLFTEGPARIMEFIERKQGKAISPKNKHICQICVEIFQSKSNMECLKEHYKEKIVSVLMKFFMLKQIQQNELSNLNKNNYGKN